MKKRSLLVISLSATLLMACSSVKLPINNQYQINSFSQKKLATHSIDKSLFVTAPDAVSGYQTVDMLYVKKPFQLEAFAKNAWIDPPASMLYPLLVQSLQHTGYFYAISSGPYTQGADYRLDTQLLNIEQDFLQKPSVLKFSAKVVLTDIARNRVIASHIFKENIPCPMDSPYGGVIAANKASLLFTEAVSRFVVKHV